MSPGEIIRERRRQLGLTQAQLATLVGRIDSSAISNIERGRIGLGHERAIRFANALGLDPKLLDGEPHEPRPTIQTILDRLGEYEAVASRDRREVLELREQLLRALELLAAEVGALGERLEGRSGQARKAPAR